MNKNTQTNIKEAVLDTICPHCEMYLEFYSESPRVDDYWIMFECPKCGSAFTVKYQIVSVEEVGRNGLSNH